MNDEEFELALRRALRAEAYRSPVALRSEVVRARASSEGASRPSRIWTALAAAAIGLTMVIVIVVSRPAVIPPGGTATSASTAACEVSRVVRHGAWWDEIGGPDAFFNARPDRFLASPFDHLVHVRFDPDAGSGETVRMWAERHGSGDRVVGRLNGEIDPANLFHATQPAPDLPGGWYLFEQRLPLDGCWTLSAAIDERVVGTAVVRVGVGTATRLPIGTHATTSEVAGLPCFAFRVVRPIYDRPTVVPAWLWDDAGGGDCERRDSDILRSRGSIVPRQDAGYDLVLDISIPEEGVARIRVALYQSGDAPLLSGVILSHDDTSVFFAADSEPTAPTPDVER